MSTPSPMIVRDCGVPIGEILDYAVGLWLGLWHRCFCTERAPIP